MRTFQKTVDDLSWFPPVNEWDFRSLPEDECRFACLWEYLRSIRTIDPNIPTQVNEWVQGSDRSGGVGKDLKTGRYLCSRSSDLALPYMTIDGIVFKPFSIDDISNPDAFVKKLREQPDPVSKYLWLQLREQTRREIVTLSSSRPAQQVLVDLASDIEAVLRSDKFFDEDRFKDVPLESGTRILFNKHTRDELAWIQPRLPKELRRYNRWLLEESYPKDIIRNRKMKPLEWRAFDAYFNRVTLMVPMAFIKHQMKQKISCGYNPEQVIDECLRDNDYRFTVKFARGGTKRVIAELKEWTIKEAKKYPRPRRGKGAKAPYEELKWLAAYRLDKLRQKHGVSVTKLLEYLKKYQLENPVQGAVPSLPLYYGESGWSKAKGDAKRLLDLLESNPAAFEKRILY